MTLDEQLELLVRRAVAAELDARGVNGAPSAPVPSPLVPLAAAAAHVSVSRKVLARAALRGELGVVGKGRLARVRLVDVEAWLARQNAVGGAELEQRADQVLARGRVRLVRRRGEGDP